MGAQLLKTLGFEGEDVAGVIDGIDFLREVCEGGRPDICERVGVIGAGDTAMDCVRSAWRIGAGDVSLIYRRTRDQMPADREEVHAATSEGVEILDDSLVGVAGLEPATSASRRNRGSSAMGGFPKSSMIH